MRDAPRVIDADSHFMEPVDWIRRTDPRVAEQVPDAMTPEQFASRVLAEVLAVVPEDRRPSMRDLFSPGLSLDPPIGGWRRV